MIINDILLGHALDVLRRMKACIASTIVTSPPYYGLRKYGDDAQAPIWEG